ncbi:Bug family tripartite tricarboxylate transporter substrate binding protein [Bradyrhizobium australiense]|uniref:Tripartite tricarboxylate transporter substrate binding protein n=1 Tax=Bradyrhizobium australiense TaxID=2721161 RepID=A0A7Y4GQL7_9BRAD|nr:tripartite tricarboxylate transporter substrate binding protein [Bradyrhizobium australiense]NOJ39919.1 tripartite tricarboxylate transporter substrate binding protein [Bradyrhizobium australiense]
MRGSMLALLATSRKLALLPMVLVLSAHFYAHASAADYPDRPVKIVVPFPAGGTADAIPRIVADWLSRKWSQPVVIENRTGAAGNIGAEQVFHSAPDGYTLLSSPPPPLVINHNLYPRLGFDPTKFEPIIVMAQVPNALIINPNSIKASSVPELIEYLKGNSDKTICATQGNGTTSHLTSELFQLMAKVKLRHIPYRGSAPALQGLVAGDVDVMFDNLGVSLALVQAGKLKLLAVASSERLPALPDVPTIAETLPGFEAVAWYGIVAPPKTPKNIVDKINADVNEALRQPRVQEQLKKLSAVIFGGAVDKSSAYMREEIDRWAAVIKSANIELQ